MKQSGGGAWTGELPKYLRRIVEAYNCGVDFSSITDASEKSDEEIKASAQDITSYQVYLLDWIILAYWTCFIAVTRNNKITCQRKRIKYQVKREPKLSLYVYALGCSHAGTSWMKQEAFSVLVATAVVGWP